MDTNPAALPHIIPAPGDPHTLQRWEHTRLRRRLLVGEWKDDLTSRLSQEVGTVRQSAWGIPKVVSNPFAVICRELASLYSREPEVRSPAGDVVYGTLAGALRASGLWAKAPRYQSMVLGLREALWRVSVDSTGRVSYRPVWPDMVEAKASESQPDQPVEIRELRWRDGFGWCWDVLCIESPEFPVYTVQTWAGLDVSADVLGGDFTGASYPYRYSDGTPFLPYVLYHCDSLGDCLWHWRDGVETVEASLDLAVCYTMLGHVLRDCSFPQRWMLGASPAGMDISEGGQRAEIVTDPATVLKLVPDPDYAGQATTGQWAAGADPQALEDVISSLANRIAIEAGLPPNDIQRSGGTARSGYAISLTNEGKRVAARRFAPIFRQADEELISKTAACLNRATGVGLPEYGYTVLYQDLPLSPDELASRRTNIIELLDAGLTSPVDAYMELHPGLNRDQAVADMARITAERNAYRGNPNG